MLWGLGPSAGPGGAWPWGGGGVLNVINDKLLKYQEETEMREIPQNQGLTCDLPYIFTFLPKTYNDPRVDTHILV